MSERFIKFIPSEESEWLLINKPNASRLLQLIAMRARREPGHPDGLEPGECYLGDWKDTNFTEQQYRTAKDILVSRAHIKIVETCRTRKKSTTGSTTVGTKVKLLSSSVWDININLNNDRINDRATTEQRPSNDKQERTRKNKNEKEEQQPVAVFSVLENFECEGLGVDEKSIVAKKYSLRTIENAIEVISSPNFKPQESLLKSFYAALKGEWKPNKGKKCDVEKNRNLSIRLENISHPYKFLSCGSYLEIIKGPISSTILYEMSEEEFKKEVEYQGRINLNDYSRINQEAIN